MKIILLAIVVGTFAALFIFRMAPTNEADWHSSTGVETLRDRTYATGFIAVRPITASSDQVLDELERVILATPRTKKITGEAGGMATYLTRSLVFGFPDYTTVEIREIEGKAVLIVHGRARFGGSDLGVNKARIAAWLAEIAPVLATT